ncbi:MAG TPA: hypothetical protein VMF06_04930 [Candidatus Limnocylindria bacterium]|nr:hypothetical protein [Candidatus Limnocylindria bacterium]
MGRIHQWGTAAAVFCICQLLHAGHPEFFTPMVDPPEWLLWDADLRLRALGGYRDNALLAETNRQSVPFMGWGGELLVTHLPLDSHSFELLVSGDDRRYTHPLDPGLGNSSATGERSVTAQMSYKYYLGKRWLPSLVVRDNYTDNVFDATSVLSRYSVRAQWHDISVVPSLRYTLPHRVWLEGGYEWNRNLFSEPLDSSWEAGPKASVGWDFGANNSLQLKYRYADVTYDSLPASDSFGNPVADTIQHFAAQRVELVWTQEWLESPRLRTTLRPYYGRNTDLAESRYYSFNRFGLAGSLQLTIGRLTLEGALRWSADDLEYEAVSQVRLLEALTLEEWQARCRADWRLTHHLSLIGEFTHERLRSNRTLTGYRTSLAWGGLEWRF